MNWLKILPGSVRSASGLEWKLWRKLPLIFLVGTALPLFGLLALHLATDDGSTEQERWLQIADYVVAGVVIFHWTVVGTVAIGCVVVMLMKGPAYVADALEVSHSDRPRADNLNLPEPLANTSTADGTAVDENRHPPA